MLDRAASRPKFLDDGAGLPLAVAGGGRVLHAESRESEYLLVGRTAAVTLHVVPHVGHVIPRCLANLVLDVLGQDLPAGVFFFLLRRGHGLVEVPEVAEQAGDAGLLEQVHGVGLDAVLRHLRRERPDLDIVVAAEHVDAAGRPVARVAAEVHDRAERFAARGDRRLPGAGVEKAVDDALQRAGASAEHLREQADRLRRPAHDDVGAHRRVEALGMRAEVQEELEAAVVEGSVDGGPLAVFRLAVDGGGAPGPVAVQDLGQEVGVRDADREAERLADAPIEHRLRHRVERALLSEDRLERCPIEVHLAQFVPAGRHAAEIDRVLGQVDRLLPHRRQPASVDAVYDVERVGRRVEDHAQGSLVRAFGRRRHAQEPALRVELAADVHDLAVGSGRGVVALVDDYEAERVPPVLLHPFHISERLHAADDHVAAGLHVVAVEAALTLLDRGPVAELGL